MVRAVHQRWRIERDYQDLKQDFGLGHYEWRGLRSALERQLGDGALQRQELQRALDESRQPESIANERNEIQIVDTHEPSETRVNIGFAAGWHQISRTLLLDT